MSLSPRTTEILELSFSITNALKTISIPEDFFSNGKSFTYSKRVSIPGSSDVDFIFDPTGYEPPEDGLNRIVVFPPTISGLGGEFYIDFYDSPVYTGGTDTNGVNRDFTSSNIISQSCIITGATVSNDGTKIDAIEWLLPSQDGQGATANFSGSMSDILPIAIDTTKKLLLKITNQNANPGTVNIRITWFEI